MLIGTDKTAVLSTWNPFKSTVASFSLHCHKPSIAGSTYICMCVASVCIELIVFQLVTWNVGVCHLVYT